MKVKHFVSLFVCIGTSLCVADALRAAPPWEKIIPFKHIDAQPNNPYPLAETNGPWTIMAATFNGEGAKDQALKLVYELRKTYRLPAYTYQKKFDFSQGADARGLDRYGAPLRMKYAHGGEINEIAVMVGDYTSVSDPQAQKVLKKIKSIEPESLKVGPNKATSQSLAGLREMQKRVLGESAKHVGPMSHAFVTTNPLLPPEYFVPKGPDKLVLDMNKGVKHCLFDCPGRYTVKVATFTGTIELDQKKIQSIEQSGKMESRLDKAADRAHRLTEALRDKGVDAYEFHDRYQSIVTIGSFETVGTPRSDGKIEINPRIHSLMKQYGSEPKNVPGQKTPVCQPKTLVGISFDVQPVPVEVPRRAVSNEFARTADAR